MAAADASIPLPCKRSLVIRFLAECSTDVLHGKLLETFYESIVSQSRKGTNARVHSRQHARAGASMRTHGRANLLTTTSLMVEEGLILPSIRSCRITEDVCAYPNGDLQAYQAVRSVALWRGAKDDECVCPSVFTSLLMKVIYGNNLSCYLQPPASGICTSASNLVSVCHVLYGMSLGRYPSTEILFADSTSPSAGFA